MPKVIKEITALVKRDVNGVDTIRYVTETDDTGVIGFGFGDADPYLTQQAKQKAKQLLDALTNSVPKTPKRTKPGRLQQTNAPKVSVPVMSDTLWNKVVAPVLRRLTGNKA